MYALKSAETAELTSARWRPPLVEAGVAHNVTRRAMYLRQIISPKRGTLAKRGRTHTAPCSTFIVLEVDPRRPGSLSCIYGEVDLRRVPISRITDHRKPLKPATLRPSRRCAICRPSGVLSPGRPSSRCSHLSAQRGTFAWRDGHHRRTWRAPKTPLFEHEKATPKQHLGCDSRRSRRLWINFGHV